MITWFDASDVGADVLDHSGAFVTEDGRQWGGQVPGHEMPVAVADTRGSDSDEDLAGSRRIEHEILDHKRRARRVEYGGLHPTLT